MAALRRSPVRRSTTAPSIPRRSSCCWPALYCGENGRSRDDPRALAQHRSGTRLDGRLRRHRSATDSSNIIAKPPTASSTKAGRTRTTRCSTPTAAWREGPIALAEVQGYVYAAKTRSRRCAAQIGSDRARRELDDRGRRARARFEERSGARSRHLRARARWRKGPAGCAASNAGQVLFSGIAAPERAARVAAISCAPALFSGWGIRTIGRREARYNPMSYHNGSVWPHDNALIALGLARYGT